MDAKFHNVESLSFEGPELVLCTDGKTYRLNLSDVSPILGAASESARQSYQVSPSGYGVHWPRLDEDLSIDGLVHAAWGSPGLGPSGPFSGSPLCRNNELPQQS